MADFKYCNLQALASDEGGYVNDPYDFGGSTNKGITLATWNQFAINYKWEQGISGQKKMTETQWKLIVKYFWDSSKANVIPNPGLASRVFHISWGSGVKVAHTLLQQSLNDAGSNLIVDGIFGPKTLEAIQSCNGELVYEYLHNRHINFLHFIAKNPTQKKFLVGWLNRVKRWYEYEKTLFNSY